MRSAVALRLEQAAAFAHAELFVESTVRMTARGLMDAPITNATLGEIDAARPWRES